MRESEAALLPQLSQPEEESPETQHAVDSRA